ncbi:MAG: histidinol-phosphate transaminase [Planctomycetota bacterium]|jgi:histidinol-phosphate aminotransferase
MGYFRKNIEQAEGYTPGFQPARTDVVKLNTNENPYPPSPQVLKAMAEISPEGLRRYPDPMGNAFRQAAAELNDVAPENIMCTNGGDDLLTIAIRAFCDADKPVAYPVPTYSLYPVLANLQNCETIEISFADNFSLPDELSSTGAALTIICNPNAPTASFIPVEKIAELAEKISGVLLIDEAYVDFSEDNCVRLVQQFDNMIILRSMSKGYSLAGIRFGYAIADVELIQGLVKVKDSYNVDTVAITVASAAIKDQDYFEENVEKIKKERSRLTEKLRQIGFKVPDSSTNFLLAQHKNCNAKNIFNELAQRDIYVRYFDLPGLDDKLRITVGTAMQNDKLINALNEILSE